MDLGANVGTTSIPFAQAGYDVIAVEPVPATFAMLTMNVERNDLGERIRCVQRAITAQPGAVDMWTGFGSGQAEVATAGTPAMERWGDRGQLITVTGVPVCDIANRDVTLVWADVQGSETTVIETGVSLWAEGTLLYLEVDPWSLDQHGGLDRFRRAVHDHFVGFVTRDDLIADRPERAIGNFDDFVGSIGANTYDDALLIPSS
jgi:FkbM family methyltransferase